MRHIFLRLAAVALSLSLFALTGCLGASQTPPSVFYQLNSLADSNPAGQAVRSDRGIAIGVGPVDFPEYLNRPQMVIRNSQNELVLDEFHRWAGPLKQNFTSVLAENLSVLLSTDQIKVFPWSRSVPTDYQVTVKVIRFDGNTGGSASLVARWHVLGEQGKEILFIKKSSFKESTGAGTDFRALVSAQSRMVAALSREITAAIKEIAK